MNYYFGIAGEYRHINNKATIAMRPCVWKSDERVGKIILYSELMDSRPRRLRLKDVQKRYMEICYSRWEVLTEKGRKTSGKPNCFFHSKIRQDTIWILIKIILSRNRTQIYFIVTLSVTSINAKANIRYHSNMPHQRRHRN